MIKTKEQMCMISTDVDEEYVIVWQDMEFNYHRMTGSRVFKSFEDAESINRTLADKRTEVMRKRDFDYLQKQQNNDETNKENA